MVGCGAGNPSTGSKQMTFPSPSDLCWRAEFPAGQEWIAEVVLVAIKAHWQRARDIARAQLGNESLGRIDIYTLQLGF